VSAPDVLVVEDEPETRSALVELLATQGLKVLEAAEGEAALDSVARLSPTVILLDITLRPSLDGIEVLRQIKASRPDLPVIMVTGTDDVRTERQPQSAPVVTP
jgi:CheY-like chemotaxis protein